MKKALYAIALLMLFSHNSFSQVSDAAQRIRTGVRYKNTLAVFNEPEIFPPRNADDESYRLLLGATFYHPLIVRLEKRGSQYLLHAKWLSGQIGYEWGRLQGQKSRRLSPEEWHGFKLLLEKASFWTLISEEKDPEPNEKGEVTVCLDGVDWFLEGSVQNKYHVVDRYCPEEGAFKAVGVYVIKLARVPFKLPMTVR
jgi:hypothetical protein